MKLLALLSTALAFSSSSASPSDLSQLAHTDLARAYTPKPLPSSHVVGGDPRAIFSAMNRHLQRQPYSTQPCESYSHDQLNELARELWTHRSPALAAIYHEAGDKRGFHFDADDALSYKERLWAQEKLLATAQPDRHGTGSEHHAMVRDGKCAELVMWWIHHLPREAREKLAAQPGFAVPLMPAHGLSATAVNASSALSSSSSSSHVDQHALEYTYQVSCTDCHSTGNSSSSSSSLSSKEMIAKGRAAWKAKEKAVADGGAAVAPGTCPIDTKTKMPSVWYQPMNKTGLRKKRCDWDYDPPCGLCEGIGGYSWGDQEHEITYTSCTPLKLAKDIPDENRTTPVWPKSFVVQEITTLINQINTGGRFPGADPCAAHKFTNDTESFYYDDSRVNFPQGPIMYTKTSKTGIYTLPTADMFIKISGVFCICVTPRQNGDKTSPATGPLFHDFAKDAVLIGRELIGLEGLDMQVEADHWNKGPHHFWVDVKTNQFVRGWQPWNGLNVYVPGTWQVGPVGADNFTVPESCYKGLLHKNVSCAAPYPF